MLIVYFIQPVWLEYTDCIRIACQILKGSVRIACRFDFNNIFYYLFLISWDAVCYQSIFPLISISVITFLSIKGNISEITSYNFKDKFYF
jgi:hypothetical protein